MAIGGANFKFLEITIYANGASGAAKTIDWRNGAIQKVSMTDDCTITLTNPIVGLARLFLNNDDPLGPYTVLWSPTILWENNSSPSLRKNRTTLIEFYYDGSDYYGKWAEYY
jgi:hypothetical protein